MSRRSYDVGYDHVMADEKQISVGFGSMTEFYNYREEGINKMKFDEYTRGDFTKRPTWYGKRASAKDMMRFGLLGDSELYENLKSKIDELNKAIGFHSADYQQKIQVSKRARVRQQFGDELDIHKVYRGDLNTAWSSTKRITSDEEHNLVTLFIDISALGGVDARDTLWRAAVAVKLYEDLVKSGKSVKIIVGGACTGLYQSDSRMCSFYVVAKEYNQPLAVERLAAMSHAGFHRSFGFGVKAAQKRKVSYGMGHSLDVGHSVPIQLQQEIEKGHTKLIILSRSDTLDGAVRNLKSCQEQMRGARDAA